MENIYYFYIAGGLVILVAAFLDRFGVVAEDEQRKNKKGSLATHSIKKNK